ncbi:MAG TPA: S9 family peptidase [Wenzhouxiangella sp.]|nr:S9 family peptidase [Wenzhouxiangella sp.]
MNRPSLLVFALVHFAVVLFVPLAASAAEKAPAPVTIDRVMVLAPLPTDAELAQKAGHHDELRAMLVERLADKALPRDGQSVSAFGQTLEWNTTAPARLKKNDSAGLWWFQLEADRFVRGHLRIEGLDDAAVFAGGKKIEAGSDGHPLDLAAGSHGIWIVHSGRADKGRPKLSWAGRKDHDRVTAHTQPHRRVSAMQLTNAETVTGMALSPNGRYAALASKYRDELADADVARLQIIDLDNNKTVQHTVGQAAASLAWSPDGKMLAVGSTSSLWLHDLDSGALRPLVLEKDGLGAWRWHPDSGSILFGWTSRDDTDIDKRKRLQSLEDRWAGFRDKSQIYQADVSSGLVRPLTAGEQSVRLHDVRGKRLLLSSAVIDYSEPPHSKTRLFELDTDSAEEREIAQIREFADIRFADDGYWLLAGPSLAIGDGDVTSDGLTANVYDTQLYRLSADGDSATSVSREFDPALGSVERLADGSLLLSATAGAGTALVHFDPEEQAWNMLGGWPEVIEDFAVSQTTPPAVLVRGSDADAPQRVELGGLDGERRALFDSRASSYRDTVLGEVHDWHFVNDDGVEIDGHYYLPPDFDESEKYPLIVYYYGGTTPVDRAFTGRYPFNLWAAHGYVIYVLQPRGAIGYGQDFSAHHVNAWGDYAADDIIEGTSRFVDEHEFVDADRIGNIGASYGGFMTMYLATKTDLFAASISHAGISDLTGYWGEGWWGWGYSGIASRGSFPWNNRELYVEHSPIYSADKISTPLLLLHGDSDTNVPPGESANMFTALKLLGREVEMVEFPGEDHWILDREQRYIWWDTMLAWYDKWLKDEPQWWEHLYP